LDGLGSTISEAHAAAAVPTTGLLPAAADEISTEIAKVFGAHAQQFHAVSAQAAAFHAEFVQALKAGAGSYAATEAFNASPLQSAEQDLLSALKAPAQPLLGPILSGGGTGNSAAAPLLGSTITATPQQFPVTGPVKLFTNTFQNLEALFAARRANPHPILSQLIANNIGYGQLLGGAFQTIGQNLATFGKGLPAVFQTTLGFLEQEDVFDAATYFFSNVLISPLIGDIGLPLVGALVPILGDIGTHISNVLHDELALLEIALVPLYGPNAGVAAMAGVSQDIVNAFNAGHFLTAFQDIALAPTTVMDGFLNGYPVNSPNSFIDPSGGLLTGVPGSSQPGFGSAGLFLSLLNSIATDLGPGSG
jgi:PE family